MKPSAFARAQSRPFLRHGVFRVCAALETCLSLILLIFAPSFGSQKTDSQAAASEASAAGVEINIQAQPEKGTVGDPIRIDVDVSFPAGYQIRFPALGDEIGDFTILESGPGAAAAEDSQTTKPPPAGAGIQTTTPGISHSRWRIIAALYKPGEFTFPPISVTARDPAGKEFVLTSSPIKIRIDSLLTDKDQDLKGLKKQAEIPERLRWILWLGSGLLLLILAAIAIWWWRRRRRPNLALASEPRMDPFALAESELRDLVARRLLERGFIKQFYVTLADIVKRVLEAGCQIQTLEKTTTEIMDALRNEPLKPAPRENLQGIESLLTACDLVKFAKYIPSKTEHDAALKSAFQILAFCKKQTTPPTAADPALAVGG